MFSLGDTLICVNTTPLSTDILAMPLRPGEEYKCLGLKLCKCGAQFVDIGLSLSSHKYDIVCHCSNRFNDGIWWFGIQRFVKKPNAKAEVAIAAEVLKYCAN